MTEEKSIIQAVSEEKEKIQRAAHFNSMYVVTDMLQLIGYRQRIAQELLRGNTDEVYRDLKELYNNINDKIKKILGI